MTEIVDESEIGEGVSKDVFLKIKSLTNEELDELLIEFGLKNIEVSGGELSRKEKIELLAQEDDEKVRKVLGL